MLSAFKAVVDIGLLFVPGGQASFGVKAAVQGAKSFYENGEEAASFFGNWIDPACGVPDFDFDITQVYAAFVGAPDSMSNGQSVGCKKKSGCRRLDPVPDPTKKPDETGSPKTTEKPATNTAPENTTPTTDTTTTDTTTTGTTTTADATTTDSTTVDTTTPTTTPSDTTSSSISSSTLTSTTGAACAYCGEFDKTNIVARDAHYRSMYARAGKETNNDPVCISPPAEDVLRKRSDSNFISSTSHLLSRFFPLFSRVLTDENTKVSTPLGRGPNPYKWQCSYGKYETSGSAANVAAISKYWRFKDPKNMQVCSVEVEQLSAVQTPSEYETDHVFEAQTLTNFIIWLANEDPAMIGTTYRKPTALWVEETLLGEGTNSFRIVSPGNVNPGGLFTPSTGEIPVVLIAYGFGRSDGVKSISGGQDVERIPAARGNANLVLLHENINGPKGIYFKKNKPSIKKTTPLEFRLDVRRGVGPFQYLSAAEQSTTDTMWKKWARVSNWIDLVCHTFDQQYKWGSRADEPTNTAGTPSLRSLWAFLIDLELGEIEAKAEEWATDAKRDFDKEWPMNKLSKDEKKWRDDVFNVKGFATPQNLKFTRPVGLPIGASVYGAYGWGDVIFDAGNQDPKIGVPIRIT
ncbi:hypothetical protein HD806DRAFT_490497 [Xylariaceae sp. AK1471]|nr:hypothetical protein HD806DRAFT_490497 [Xylariaceae sp. AK1471]